MEGPDPPRASRLPRGDSQSSGDRIALGSALFGGLLAAVLVSAGLALSQGGTRSGASAAGIAATDQLQVATQGGSATTAEAASPSPRSVSGAASSVPTSVATGPAHIANTGGQGVVLRASPRDDDRTPRGFEDGDAVTVVERSGSDWARVRGANGQEGWVPSKYLGP